ncbi:MAG: FGGY-family carbohydrate kinase, partial [Desulfobacterales bacterium]|nr:FGGY-family carbohydrate kinase [Desulfobacterales bacterium]
NISSLGLDTWGADFGLLDAGGKLLSNPINYRDEQSARDSESLFEIIPGRELFGLTGAWCIPLFDLFQLYSLKKNDSASLKSAKTYLSIGDLFNYFLTGEIFNEFTRFTTSVLYNQRERKIEESLFKKLGLPAEIFPEMIYPGQKVGNISNEVTGELGIDTFPVIAPAIHDTASAVAGIPVKDGKKKWAFMSLGTWACMGVENNKVLISDEIYDAVFSNEAGVEDTNIFVKNINGLWVIQKCREKWLKDKDISWDGIVDLSREAAPFASFIDVDQPQFAQPQIDMPRIIREYCKKTGQSQPDSIGEVARCVYESLALKFRYYFEILARFSGQKFEVLHLVGGGTQNKLLCQWISDVNGIPVISGPAETTAVGNLLMQLKADGEIANIEEGRKISLKSSAIDRYEPQNKTKWDEIYNKYLKIIKK